MDDLLPEFLSETAENLQTVDNELVRFERDPDDADALGHVFRLVHTVKGSCGFIGLPRLEKVAHAAETLLGKLRDGDLKANEQIVTETLAAIAAIRTITSALGKTGEEPDGDDAELIERLDALSEGRAVEAPKPAPKVEEAGPITSVPAAQSIRVSVDLLEELMTSVSELVLTRNQLLQERRRSETEEMDLPLQRLSAQIGRLQDSVMRTRMQPISGAWGILPRIVRQLSVDLGKQIDLDMTGGDTELDRQMLELIKDPLAHMVRNAADHGLEDIAGRRSAGKNATGKIKLSAAQEGGHIIVTLADDGRGLDYVALREKATRGGHMTAAQAKAATEMQLSRLIFAAGMSTAKEITQVSGRGVGMDVVRANIEKIGGTIEVDSRTGFGTTFRIRIPLTLAIMPALIVGVGPEERRARFAIPQIAVAELVRAGEGTDNPIEQVGGAPVLRLRGRLLPLVYLGETLKTSRGVSDHVLIIRGAGTQFGILVDEVFDTEELVVKPVPAPLADLSVYSGNAILGDGQVIMILDANGLADDLCADAVPDEDIEPRQNSDMTNRDAMLLFRAGGLPHPRAVPLALVSRIEDIDVERIERSGGTSVVQLRERLVPLVSADGDYTPIAEGRQAALIFADRHDVVALAVDEVIDIVDVTVKLEMASDDPARLGTAVIAGQATELLDVAHLLTENSPKRGGPGMAKSEAAGARILVVDDSPFFRNMLMPLLSAAGYRVTTAAGVDEALGLRDSGKTFDLILSDIEMPEKTGLDFARAVRAGGDWVKTPLVALSSLAEEEDMDAGMLAGFDRYVAKFDRRRLLGLLETSLKAKREHAA
ncbi:MAG: chemotaxis protein CheW [Pacificimonas sp.]